MRLIILISLWASVAGSLEAKTLLDPTEPQGGYKQNHTQADEVEPLVLNAVFLNGENKYAIINGKQYQKNDLVQGDKLILISQNQVILNTNSGQKTLFINTHNIKKDINNGF